MGSDLDVLVVRPDRVDEDDPHWTEQLERSTDDVRAWTGDPCSIVELKLKNRSRYQAAAVARGDACEGGRTGPDDARRGDCHRG